MLLNGVLLILDGGNLSSQGPRAKAVYLADPMRQCLRGRLPSGSATRNQSKFAASCHPRCKGVNSMFGCNDQTALSVGILRGFSSCLRAASSSIWNVVHLMLRPHLGQVPNDQIVPTSSIKGLEVLVFLPGGSSLHNVVHPGLPLTSTCGIRFCYPSRTPIVL